MEQPTGLPIGQSNQDAGHTCPGPDLLAAFAGGALDVNELERIGEHLASCAACETCLEEMAPETLAGLLRGPKAPLTDGDYQRLKSFACALVPGGPDLTVADPRNTSMVPTGPATAQFGAYELLEKLGQGSMGVVWKARHQVLQRFEALKLMPVEAETTSEALQRFCIEGEAAARLDHPNVVRIYGFGECEGRLYCAMELVEGGTLSARLRNGRLFPHEAARLVAALARGVQAAHEQNIVHRDLKPSNVLLDAGGAPKITDFGLARLTDEMGQTLTGAYVVLGTVLYMAPEQAAGQSHEAGPAADVWALGAILYECLTGRCPFRGKGKKQTLEMVQHAEPVRPSQLCLGLSRDLEAVCLRCLSKPPGDRYASAAELADDLDRWLQGLPTKARPVTLLGRLARAVRRRPRTCAAAALLVLVAGLAALAAYYAQPVVRVARALRNDREVTLIGAKGMPIDYQVVTEPEKCRLAVGNEDACTVYAGGWNLIELASSPHRARFRFRADVCHEKSSPDGAIGIYVMRQVSPVAAGTLHHYAVLAFCDQRDDRDLFRNPGMPPPPIDGNRAALCPAFFLSRPIRAWEGNMASGPRLTFQPGGFGNRVWRRLAIEVSPQGIKGAFDGRDFDFYAAETFVADQLAHVHESSSRKELAPFVTGFAPTSTPDGGIGLYVEQGSASFRNVVIEPPS